MGWGDIKQSSMALDSLLTWFRKDICFCKVAVSYWVPQEEDSEMEFSMPEVY